MSGTAVQRHLWLHVLPGLAVVGLVLGFPIAYSVWMVTHSLQLASPTAPEFVGFGNLLHVFADERLGNAVINSLRMTIVSTILPVFLGTVTAFALNALSGRARSVYLTVLLIPVFIPFVAGGLLWLLLLHPQQGIVSYVLERIGFGAQSWLGNPKTAWLVIVGVDTWHQTTLVTVLVLGGLISIPRHLFEAARIDGANARQQLQRITLPLLRGPIAAAAAVRFVIALMTYDLVYILTQGGPGRTTETVPFYIGRVAFRHLDFGYASALSWWLLAVTVIGVGMILIFGRGRSGT